MKAECFMVMVLFASVVAVPVQMESNHLVQRTLSEASQTHNPPMSQAPQSLRPVAQLLNQSHNQTIPTFRHLTQVSSGLKATKAPTAPKKIEEFATKLRADMDAQERVLNVFIKTIKDKHASTESKLKQVKAILKGLKDEINNATKYANAYQSQDTDLTKQDTLYKTEYDKSYKMYLEEQANIKFEKQFLDAILQYIKLRKTQKC